MAEEPERRGLVRCGDGQVPARRQHLHKQQGPEQHIRKQQGGAMAEEPERRGLVRCGDGQVPARRQHLLN